MTDQTGMPVPVELIDPNPEQPRQNFDQDGLEDLATSIREVGLIQPVTVEITADGRYILHDGERRWRAAKLAGLEEIPAYIVGDQADSQELLTRALVANVQREDLNPLEVARAYQKLKDLGLSDQAIADCVGKSRSTVTNSRRLLELPEEAQALVDKGVSERALAALLPMYKLPEEIINIGDDDDGHGGYSWNSPRALLAEIAEEGTATTSEHVRRRVGSIINAHTVNLDRANWPLDHAFDGDGLRSSRCDKCPTRMKADGEWRCAEQDCFDAKKHRWSADILQAASEASGIPFLEGDPSYTSIERFYTDSDLLESIMADGCDNLRLAYEPYRQTENNPRQLPGHDHVFVACQHGRGKHCTCLSKKRAEKTKNDPLHIAVKEREKELNRLVDQYAHAMDQALAGEHAKAWLMVLRTISYSYSKRGDDWDFDQVRAAIARELVRNKIGWQAKDNPEVGRNDLANFFDALGLTRPDRGDDIQDRFERIRRWIRTLDRELPSLAAVNGNIANLDKLTVDVDDGHSEAHELYLEIADAWEMLISLRDLLGRPGFEIPDFDHVEWLVTVPSGDVNFKSHLEDASAEAISYALLLTDGRDGHKTRVAALERQLRALEQAAD